MSQYQRRKPCRSRSPPWQGFHPSSHQAQRAIAPQLSSSANRPREAAARPPCRGHGGTAAGRVGLTDPSTSGSWAAIPGGMGKRPLPPVPVTPPPVPVTPPPRGSPLTPKIAVGRPEAAMACAAGPDGGVAHATAEADRGIGEAMASGRSGTGRKVAPRGASAGPDQVGPRLAPRHLHPAPRLEWEGSASETRAPDWK